MSSEKGRHLGWETFAWDSFVACPDLYLSFGSHFLINKRGKKNTAGLSRRPVLSPRLPLLSGAFSETIHLGFVALQ